MSLAPSSAMLRFAAVGVGVAALYVAIFVGLAALGLSRGLANVAAFGLAVAVQYVAQSLWTFRKPLDASAQALRFAVAIGLGLVVSTLITSGLGPRLGWPAWMAAGLVTVVLPVQNYLFFRLWVFADADPGARQ